MERISVTARLNRSSTLAFDDAAYARLERYLADSASLLEGDPEPQEILTDLEQAIADKCSGRLQAGQTVVTLADLEAAIAEIGAVQVPGAAPAAEGAPRETPRRLQQVSEGAVISGVCQGLARYFGLNVTALRVFAVLLLLFSGGGMILVYLALMVLLPFAPRDPRGQPVGWLPTKCREFAGFVQGKLSIAPS